ncbi:thioredoxin family protein [Fredinandcohnia humi]
MKELNEKEIDESISNEQNFYLYLYTPMCGTCQVASKMLSVVKELLPAIAIGKSDLNYIPKKAIEWEIESVPCLLLFKNGTIYKKVYAFHSVPYLLETINE